MPENFSTANQPNIPLTSLLFQHVSRSQIEEARARQKTEGNNCQTCAIFGAKGFVENAGQWVHCFSCNPTPNKVFSPEPLSLTLSDEQQAAYVESPHTCPFPDCRSEELDATESSITGSGEIHQPVVCYGCGRKWTDVYVLNRVIDIEAPD